MPGAAAVIVADPADSAVTFPESETVATAGLSLDHVTARNTRCPAASRSWTASCRHAPMSIVSGVGVTVTLATGAPRTASQVPLALPHTVDVQPGRRGAGAREGALRGLVRSDLDVAGIRPTDGAFRGETVQ